MRPCYAVGHLRYSGTSGTSGKHGCTGDWSWPDNRTVHAGAGSRKQGAEHSRTTCCLEHPLKADSLYVDIANWQYCWGSGGPWSPWLLLPALVLSHFIFNELAQSKIQLFLVASLTVAVHMASALKATNPVVNLSSTQLLCPFHVNRSVSVTPTVKRIP